MSSAEQIVLSMDEVQDLLDRAKAQLSEKDYEMVKMLVDSYVSLTKMVREKGTTIARLRRLLGGFLSSEKTKDVLDQQEAGSTADDGHQEPGGDEPDKPQDRDQQAEEGDGAAPSGQEAGPDASTQGKRKPGHGRNGAEAYQGAERVGVAHETLKPGDPCPECPKGKVYRIAKPAVIVRITGQSPLQACIWELERLRCNLCGLVLTAAAPAAALGNKYSETAASMIALLKYGTGLPFNRLDRLQANLGTPLPSSTQWEVVNALAEVIDPAYVELVQMAAQGTVLHNDDTHAKILALMGKRREKLLARGELDDPERTGLFTTGIVSVCGDHKIAMFFTGRKHAGENLAKLLDRRAADLGPPIQMSDALSRNLPKGHEVIESNCIAHGRRKVVDEVANFPDECRHVLEALSEVYEVDERCRKQGLSDDERLLVHQHESASLMRDLEAWMQALLDEKKIEPNSGLGEAFNYMLKRWDKLTLFLRMPGAPLDNNIVERALKKAILHRKNALFYRSERGAHVGDMLMTLIYTAELHGESPFDYLTELQRHADAVAESPADWLPWCYKATLAELEHEHDDRTAAAD